jgi:hypothetical protein
MSCFLRSSERSEESLFPGDCEVSLKMLVAIGFPRYARDFREKLRVSVVNRTFTVDSCLTK